MAYVINKTDGTTLVTITDGTVDNTTSLSLFGKSYSGFGEALNEDLVKLLENSASTSAPSAPLAGELWYDKNTNQLKVYDGSSFKPTGGAKVSTSQPSSPSSGDLWMDSTNKQLYFYSGSAWLLAGPVYTTGQTLSGWKIETVNNSSGVSKVIASMFNGNTRVAILSSETFTPASGAGSPALTANGFATVYAGLTLNTTLGAQFAGNSSQATAVDVSSTTNTSATVIAGGNFLRADAADTTVGALTIDTDSGILVGDQQEFTVTVSSGHVVLSQTREDKDLSVKINDGGVTKTPIAITGSTGDIALTGDVTITGNLNVSGEYNNTSSGIITIDDAFVKVNNGNGEVDAGLIVETSDTDDARMFYDVSENYWSAGEGGTYSQVIRLSDATTDGNTNKEKVLKTDASGRVTATYFARPSVETITTSNTATTDVPSTGAVVNLINSEQPKWGSSEKTVSTSAPTSGDGANGDFWFVREA